MAERVVIEIANISSSNCLTETMVKNKKVMEVEDSEGNRSRIQQRHERFYPAVILVSGFVVQFLTAGAAYSTGVYHVMFLEVFRKSSGQTAWLTSMNLGFLCATGPISGALCNRFGTRKLCMVGGILASASLLASAFVTNITALYFTFGLCCALGYSFSFMPSLVSQNHYFTKWRATAVGIAFSGIGCGVFCFPILIPLFQQQYGWRGALMLHSGMTLHLCVAGALLRPNPPPSCANTDGTDSKDKTLVLNIAVFKNGHFLALFSSSLLYCLGLSVVNTHIAAYAKFLGFGGQQSTFLISAIGVFNLIGRIILGVLAKPLWVNVQLLLFACHGVSAIVAFGLTFDVKEYSILMTMVCVYGFCYASAGSVIAEAASRVMGVEEFSSAFGFNLLGVGIGVTLGAPIAGWLYDGTGVYAAAFYFGAAAMFLAALIIALPTVYDAFHTNRPIVKEEFEVSGGR